MNSVLVSRVSYSIYKSNKSNLFTVIITIFKCKLLLFCVMSCASRFHFAVMPDKLLSEAKNSSPLKKTKQYNQQQNNLKHIE